ncbi:MAG: hypothetical protein ACLGSD_07970 [Acidobacteriota bacterium]
MRSLAFFGLLALSGAVVQAQTAAPQQPPAGTVQASPAPSVSPANAGPVPLDWTPPALSLLSSQAAVKNSFTLDRSMLAAAASTLPQSDADEKQAIGHLDGLSVHMLRFANGIPDEGAVNSIRDAYHLRGWKHVVTTTDRGGPVHDGKTDVWVVMDGVNVRGAVVLMETPKSLTLATVAGDLSPIDLLHLRGHFGIPQFDSSSINGATNN